ncbi:TRAP transporter small permease subunit [Sulfurirhabdus autotrophica]|uniref:TRAP transporter small permease protein n=2 Tax=Sulfurirhabdus autotrophica TaxID=1706046 RepID=A0A4R3XTD8_9PROT|nr:TRAP transporter small permease subunit [Sulfurirhabdus autotrophica]TCV82360.1 TRAP-type mannitol/chloroaromatic compound transport system permease small subunit [Sulfurirhabdus autotrophica]
MKALLRIAHLIDYLNERVGHSVYWLILVTVLISTGNAISRKLFNVSSNAFLEIQWYLFSAVFLLAAGYTLKQNEHVRVDVISGRFSKRTQAWLDIFGGLFFLLPMSLIILYYSWPFFTHSLLSQEWSGNPGGLILWPAKALIPAGFLLLLLQGIAEIIKRIGFLLGIEPPEPPSHPPLSEFMDASQKEGEA